MYLYLIKILTVCVLAQTTIAQEDVASWLQRMGCIELQATYLEEQLESGNRTAQVKAAKQLADVYATMLARADEETDKELLQRAISLFDRIPAAGTIDLRLQLFRATFIAAEQILERYRLRISDRDEARLAITQLKEVANNLESFRQSLLKRVRSARSSNEKLQQNLGLITSYLAWTRYYIAWFDNDRGEAQKAAQLFAEILLGDRPSLQSVSLDLKHHESGARAILGIALCKSILQYPSDPEPWFEELEAPEAWSSVRLLVPLWKFFILIDQQKWEEILVELDSSKEIEKTLLYRVAAVHSLEDYSTEEAKEVAKKALLGLIEIGELGILSDIVKKNGSDALEKDGFISKYIEGDIEFRELRNVYQSDKPASDEETRLRFASIADTFNQAMRSFDIEKYNEFIDDCQFLLGLTLYYSSQFDKAAKAFIQAAEGDNKEQSLWMAIVCLDYLDPLHAEQQRLKEELSDTYLESWPNTEHATQLLIQQSGEDTQNPENIEDLLAIPHSDPRFEDAQRQASRSLYQMWQNSNSEKRAYIGNRYVTIAISLMVADSKQEDDPHANEVAAIRALRILEIALHPKVQRIVASARALEILQMLDERNIYSLQAYQHEITYRKVLLLLLQDSIEEAALEVLTLIEIVPDNEWTNIAAKQLWDTWTFDGFPDDDEKTFLVGTSILDRLTNTQFGQPAYISISKLTAEVAFDIFQDSHNAKYGKKALEISRILVGQHPRIAELLIQNAEIETELGDAEIALQQWKSVASGTATASEEWLRARFNIILLLAQQSPEKALAVLEQHHTLYPNYGKEPYGSKLRDLHSKLKGETSGS